MSSKKLKISFVINIIIFMLTLIASIIMFAGIEFMKGNSGVLVSTKLEMFKFFTVDSNIFMGIMALMLAIDEYKLLSGKIEEIPKYKYALKLMSTTGVALTFFTVFLYLGPISEYGIYSLLLNSNLFYHLFIPVLSMLVFTIFEGSDKLSLKYSVLGIIPSVLYTVFYLINVLIHMENGKVSPLYDWYYFVQNGVWTTVIVLPFMLCMTYLLSFILLKLNQISVSKNY